MANKTESTSLIPLEKTSNNEVQPRGYYLAEKENPLRTVVMLHAEPVWIGVILTTIVIQFLIILYNISFRGRLLNITKEPKDYPTQSYLMMMDALYCADFLLAWSYRSWKSLAVVSSVQPRKMLWLIVDVVSLIPVDTLLWYGSNLAMTNPRVFHLWSLNHLMRIYRVYLFFEIARNSVAYVSVHIHLLEVLTVLLVSSMIATVIMFEWKVDVEKEEYNWLDEIVKRLKPDNYRASDWFWISFYVVIGHVSSHGTVELPPETNHLPFTIFAMIDALIIRSLLLAYMVDIIHRRDYAESIFSLKRTILGELLTTFKILCPEKLRLTLGSSIHITATEFEMYKARVALIGLIFKSAVSIPTQELIYKYYASFWETQGGQNCSMSEFTTYPVVFRAECSLELTWDTFKHSKLFRHMPVPFLRNLSLLCERRFVLPGDYIIQKFDLKDRMIYIVSGSVHVLSEEDNETPILSFSGGTIFGEIGLFASYRSGVSVLACTRCELNVLERNKFARIIVPTFPNICEELTTAIDTRINNARFMKEIGIHLQKNRNIFENNRNTDVAWLKTTLTGLQGARRVDGDVEEMKERANKMATVYATTDIRYTFMYLDTIVLSDVRLISFMNIDLTSDAVFLQSSKCPWILQPYSPVLALWDKVVIVCAIIQSYMIVVSITFPEFETASIKAWTNFLGLVLTADFWITLATAIQKNDRIVIIKVSQILKIRLHNWSFWFDLLAAIPWTFMISHLSIKRDSLNSLRLIQLLKLYKLEIMFKRIENSHRISLVVLRTIKYSVYITLVSFFLTAMALILTCPVVNETVSCPPTSWISTALAGYDELKDKIWSYSLLIVLQIILGIGSPIARPGAPLECAYWVILLIVGSLFLLYYMASLTCVRVLGQVIVARHFHLSRAIHYHLNQTTVPEVLKKRVDAYLETELFYDKGYRMATKEDVLSTLSKEMSGTWKYERFGRFISAIPLFMEIDEGFVRDICSVARVSILPPKELLSYGGRHCMEMYIIEKGYCEMVHMKPSIPHRKVGPGTAIYPVEMCLQLPVVHTVVTSTYVSFLTINRSDFLRVYSNYPEDKFEFDQLMTEIHRMDRVSELREMIKDQPEFIEVLHSVRPPVPSFTFFVYTLNKEDPEFYVINQPFEQLKNLKFIKWFLLRLTLRPDGMFMKFYEAQRCLCAILTVFFYTMRILIEASESGTFAVKIITFLNITAVIDIYVRLHIGYFNEKGLLVTHPLATAINYMKTSMFVDVLGLLPFEQLILKRTTSSIDLFYLYSTRVLQLHRVVGATNYLQESNSWMKIIKYGKFLPILLVMAHLFACIVLYTSCTFDIHYESNDQFQAGLRCPERLSFIEMNNDYKLTVWMVYRGSLYIATSTLMRFGVEHLRVKTPSMMNVLYIMSAGMFIVLLLLVCQIIADSAIRDGELTAYQDRMTTMVKFLKNKRISPELYREVVYYFELAWKDKRGQSVDQLFKSFHSALREDVLCALYSKSLSKCPGFVNASESFYRYLLVNMRGVWFYPNGSVVVHYNDVLVFVVILHTGSAEVVAPDGSFITTLGPGSIYGNLIGSTTVRMPVSIVVTAHSEVLVINSDHFFRALSLHSKAKRDFLNAMELNTDYIRGIVDDQDWINVPNETSSPEEQSQKNPTIFVRIFLRLSIRVVDPNWFPIILWYRASLLFSCYLSPCAIIYQVAYGDFHTYFIIFQYVTDFIFIATMYLKIHSAFEDAYGNIVRDKKRIWIRFIKSPMGLYVFLASVVPIEVISFIFKDKTMQKLYAWLRVNRLLRLAIVVNFFNIQCKRLNINIFRMRLAYLVMILFFTIHLATCVLVVITSTVDVYDLEASIRRSIYMKNMFNIAALYGGSVTRRLPVSSPWYQTFYILVLEITMLVMFALIVGDMCAMIDVKHYVMVTYERVIRRFRIYMETCDLTYVLKQNLWTYGCSLWKFNRGRQIPYLVIEAPTYLRKAIKNAMFIHHLENHMIFSGCHEDFLRQLADRFILMNFFADNVIVNIGDINGDMYFVHSGKVVTIHHDPNNILKEQKREIYEEGTSFGILSGLLPRYPHRATHRAFGKCKILILNRKKWLQLLNHFPASKEHIYSIVDILRMRKGVLKL